MDLPWQPMVLAMAATAARRRRYRGRRRDPPSTALLEAVQTNCHIADARHAQDLSLCTFLLQIREFHRWGVACR